MHNNHNMHSLLKALTRVEHSWQFVKSCDWSHWTHSNLSIQLFFHLIYIYISYISYISYLRIIQCWAWESWNLKILKIHYYHYLLLQPLSCPGPCQCSNKQPRDCSIKQPTDLEVATAGLLWSQHAIISHIIKLATWKGNGHVCNLYLFDFLYLTKRSKRHKWLNILNNMNADGWTTLGFMWFEKNGKLEPNPAKPCSISMFLSGQVGRLSESQH